MVSDELKQIREKIKEKKAKWVADETSVSKLPPEERKKHVMSKKIDDHSIKKKEKKTAIPELSKPSYLDWRNTELGNFVTPIKNQDGCGSCWAFGCVAAEESAVLLKNKTPYLNNPIDISEQVAISCSGAGSCDTGDETLLSDFLVNTGLPAESCYPYLATIGNCNDACINWRASAYRISDYTSLYSPNVPSIEDALFTYGPLVADMPVYDDFMYYAGGIYSYVTGSLVGYHCICIVGYDHNNQYFIVKNSWGTGWGESGYFRIAYSETTGRPFPDRFAYYAIAYNTDTPVNCPDTLIQFNVSLG